jgi:hypothetical protein
MPLSFAARPEATEKPIDREIASTKRSGMPCDVERLRAGITFSTARTRKGRAKIRFATAPLIPSAKKEEIESPMANDDTLVKALASVRRQRESLEVEHERVGGELTKLRLAERSLASIVEGTLLDEPADDLTTRRRASASEDRPRGSRGPRGPRANSAKGRLKTLLEEAGSEGLTHAEISERLTDVAANTLNTYLSVMASSGELERQGDKYRTGAPAANAADEGAVEDDRNEGDQEDSKRAEAAE